MTTGRYRRRRLPAPTLADRIAAFGGLLFAGALILSLSLHLTSAALFLHRFAPPHIKAASATVYVDLVTAPPVTNPRRGNPAAALQTQPEPPRPAPVQPAKSVAVAAKPAIRPVAKKAESKKPADDAGLDDFFKKAREKKLRQNEQNEAEAAIAALKSRKTATSSSAAAGSVTGSGEAAGSGIEEWLRVRLREKWSWSDTRRRDLSASIEIEIDANGRLSNYRIVRPSGNAYFDESLKRALLRLEPLPQPLHKTFKDTVTFTLDDLQGS